ncbi:hypothetical protein FACS1894151_11560 [Spirochaetia bacterium]|nr:hypothetical protein FACS1894151_11560 [Spirochaetia bacterium]
MNEYENSDNPYEEKREAIKTWEKIAKQVCPPTDTILTRGNEIQKANVKPKDSLHLSCAIESGCEYFITTDVPLLKKRALFTELNVINPIDFVREMEAENASSN